MTEETKPPMTEDEIKALQESMYKDLLLGFKEVGERLLNGLEGESTFIAVTVLHAVHAQEVGRMEKIIEEAAKRAKLKMPDLVKERRTRMALGRSFVARGEPT